jgi:hypothetical protein
VRATRLLPTAQAPDEWVWKTSSTTAQTFSPSRADSNDDSNSTNHRRLSLAIGTHLALQQPSRPEHSPRLKSGRSAVQPRRDHEEVFTFHLVHVHVGFGPGCRGWPAQEQGRCAPRFRGNVWRNCVWRSNAVGRACLTCGQAPQPDPVSPVKAKREDLTREVFTFRWGLFSRLGLTFRRAGWRLCGGRRVACFPCLPGGLLRPEVETQPHTLLASTARLLARYKDVRTALVNLWSSSDDQRPGLSTEASDAVDTRQGTPSR